MWRRWTISSATEQEPKLSLVDDWRHCCCCSGLKWRGAASLGRGQAVFPQKIVQTFSFHLMLNTCSGRSESSYFDALNSPLIMSFSLTPFFISHHLCSIRCSKARMGEPIFPPGTCMINVWTCKLYEELALRGVTYGRNSCMMKQENSTMKIFWVTVIGSPKSLEFKMLQEGFALMQNNIYMSHVVKIHAALAGDFLFVVLLDLIRWESPPSI